MIRHQQFNLHFLAAADFRRTRADAHAGLNLGFTGRYDLTAALGFERDRLAVDKGAAAEVRHFVFVGISHCRSLLGILFNR